MAEAVALAGVNWAMTVTGWVASPIISKLLNEGYSCLGIDMANRFDKLEATILPQFQEVIEAAERSEHKSNLEKWLRRLKKAMFKAEDALDLYKYRLLQQKVENDGSTMKKNIGKFTSSFSFLSTENIKLRKCLNKLEKIALEAKEFRDLLKVKSNPNYSIIEPTTSTPPSCIFGRGADCDNLVQQLLEPVASKPESSKVRSYTIHSIVGVGGAGKTTLAQLVYNDERVIDEFNHRIWLSMTRGLDLYRDTRIMVEAVSENECPRLESLDKLQAVLKNLFKSNKILVIMDDVWWDETMDEEKWKLFVDPLANLKRGSRIIVTSRTEKMPRVLLPQKMMPLKELEENYFLSLFMHHAFNGLELNSILSQKLEIIGKRIAKKLSRSPLAAKVVGSRLYKNPNEQFWADTLEREMLTDTMQSLFWSYQNLQAPIQRCFSYCAIFPKAHSLRKEDLILLWVAEGFIPSSPKRMEDEAEDYFRELLSVFFFHIVDDMPGHERYGIHDLFHDLAERVSMEDCFRIEDGKFREIPSIARHFSIQGESFIEYITSFEKLKNIRTVIFISPVSNKVINLFLKKIKKFTKLRVLHFTLCSNKELPKSVGELMHLRYLNLQNTRVAQLPKFVQKLCNLQTLKLDIKVTNLPSGLTKLVNLRHLILSDPFKATTTLPDIGKLTSLQELCHFTVKNEKGYEIAQLKWLNEIRDSLSIYELGNIKNRDEATEASLKDKKHVDSLTLFWGGGDDAIDGNSSAHLEVFEGLQPHPNLKYLRIAGYNSPKFPSWMFQQGSLENLSSLRLTNCSSLEVLPPMSTLFPLFHAMDIIECPRLTKLPKFPSSLKELWIKDCWSLVFIYEELEKDDYEVRILKAIQNRENEFILETKLHMTNHARMKLLKECSKLWKLMEWDSHRKLGDVSALGMYLANNEVAGGDIWEANIQLIKLTMEYMYSKKEKCPLVVPSCIEKLSIFSCYITDRALMHCLAQLTCLVELKLRGIRTITVLPPKEVFSQLVVLNDLEISSCEYLISLGGLHVLVSIKYLHIGDCPCLEIPGEGGRGTLPSSLESVVISNCYSIRHFQVLDLQLLSSATFSNCQQLKSMVLRNISSLKELEIESCPELELIYSDMPVLERLEIEKCFALQDNFSSGNMAWASLKEIQINSFSMLGKLPSRSELVKLEILSITNSSDIFFDDDEFGCLTSLSDFNLDDCKVQALPCSMKNLSSLRRITLQNCYELLSLPDMPETMRYLFLAKCPSIESLPVLPKSLFWLYISGCPNLSKRCQEPDGEDWPKISHIQFREVE